MSLHRIVAVSLLCVSSVAAADTLDIALSNSAAQFKYGVPSSLAGKSEMYAEMMYNDVNSLMGGAGVLVANEQGNGLSVGIGAKVVAANIKWSPNRKNTSAVALGAQLRFEVPAERRLAFSGEFYYAPKIITFGDADSFQQFGVRMEYAISHQTLAYVGYRKISFGLPNTNNEAVMVNGPHIGIQLAF